MNPPDPRRSKKEQEEHDLRGLRSEFDAFCREYVEDMNRLRTIERLVGGTKIEDLNGSHKDGLVRNVEKLLSRNHRLEKLMWAGLTAFVTAVCAGLAAYILH